MAADDQGHTPTLSLSSRSFDGNLAAPSAARHFVAEVLDREGAEDVLDDAKLVVTELATNAVAHAESVFTVGVELGSDTLHIAVSDNSPRRPTLQPGPSVDSSGRGLVLVAELCERWGAARVGQGKTVWAQLRRPRAGAKG